MCKRVGQIPENGAVAGLVAGDDLVEINIVGKFFQCLARFRRGRNFERGTQMDFADLDAVIDEAGQGVVRLLEFDSEMAGVVVDAEMRVESRVVRMLGAEMVEGMNCLRAAFKQTERFRFEVPFGLKRASRDEPLGSPA